MTVHAFWGEAGTGTRHGDEVTTSDESVGLSPFSAPTSASYKRTPWEHG